MRAFAGPAFLVAMGATLIAKLDADAATKVSASVALATPAAVIVPQPLPEPPPPPPETEITIVLAGDTGLNGSYQPVYASFGTKNGQRLSWADATAEIAPVFNGVLIRNFITPDAVNDRLFSLLSFIHIGLPLAVLLVLWIHTQRVPRASVMPPKALAIYAVVALVALSLVKPIYSQGGPADLATTVSRIELDWFYLPVYALLHRWTPIEVWYLVGGATLLFLLLPWLPPKRMRKEAFHMLVHPDNRIVPEILSVE